MIRFVILFFTVFATGVLAKSKINDESLKMKYMQEIKKVEASIEKKVSKHNIVGLSIALVDGQEVVWKKGFGYADKENKIRATPETIYRIGSITKLFNAVAVMKAVEQGNMQLTAPLKNYLPAFSMRSRFANSADSVTVKNILTHHSGIVSDWPKGMWGETVEPFTTLVDSLQDTHLAFPPDQLFSYSNAAVTLLGHALQNVVHDDYVIYINKSILQPLQMQNSYLAKNIKVGGNNSRGYIDNKVIVTPDLRDTPAGGLNSSVLDLAKFAQMIINNGQYHNKSVLKPETVAAMLTPQNTDNEFDVGNLVGLGWLLARAPGEEDIVAWHNGGTFSFFSDLRLSVKHKLAVVVLSNTEGALPVISKISQDLLDTAIKAKTSTALPVASKIKNKKIPMAEADLQNLPGYYSAIEGLAIVSRKKNKLKVNFNNSKLNLIKRQNGDFYLAYKLFGFIPMPIGEMSELAIQMKTVSGKEVLFGRLGEDRFLIGEKIQPQHLSDIWLSRLGDYKVTNLEAGDPFKIHGVSLYEKKGFLLVNSDASVGFWPKSRKVVTEILRVLDDQTAYIAGLGRNKGSVLHITQLDGKEVISINGYQFEKQAAK